MIRIEMEGFDDLERQLKEAGSAFEGFQIPKNVNPKDPADVERAIEEMERAIEERAGRYSGNMFVRQIADQAKERFRQEILKRTEQANSDDSRSD